MNRTCAGVAVEQPARRRAPVRFTDRQIRSDPAYAPKVVSARR